MPKIDTTGFYKKSLDERLKIVQAFAGLSDAEIALFKKFGSLDFETANRMIENVIGTFNFPLGIATNFIVNGKELLVPMAIEEPSVVAAASNAARLCQSSGGFSASATAPEMIGQIQLVGVKSSKDAIQKIKQNEKRLVEFANTLDSVLIKLGGGCKRIEGREIKTQSGSMLIVHLVVDVRDAMGANAVNTMCERLAPELETITGGTVRLRIISNLAVYRLARAKAVWKKEELAESIKNMKISPDEVVDRILDAYYFADNDVFRATTFNKGIMNGIDAVAIATGQDFRALESGAHSYATYKNGEYKPLTWYYKDKDGNLAGEIELPMAVGLVGGATKTHPLAGINLKLLKVKTAQDLAEIMAAVGLAQNFAAQRVLATEGIQRGHMGLHAKNIAIMAGAKDEQIEKVAEQLAREKNVSVSRAGEILKGKK